LGTIRKTTGLALIFDADHACAFARERSLACVAITYNVVDANSLETIARYKQGMRL
jgi:hypothetical protein